MKKIQVLPLQAMIQAVAAKMAPITTGLRMPSPDRKARKRQLRRRQRDNFHRGIRDVELYPSGSKMARQCQKDSKRGADGTLR